MRKVSFRMVETGLALVSAWWGVVLALPQETFSNTVYTSMATLQPEMIWSIISLSISACITVGMFTDNKVLRSVGLLTSIGFWTFVSVSLWLGDHVTTGTSYFVWAIMAARLYIHQIKAGDG